MPQDPAGLRALVERLQRERDGFYVAMLRLQMENLRLKKQVYGPRADRLRSPEGLAQMLLEFAREWEAKPVDPADLPEPLAPEGASEVRRVRRRGRRNLAGRDDLPTTRYVHDLTPEQRKCQGCGAERQRIGEDLSWQIELVPAHLERLEHVQVKYACAHCEAAGEPAQLERAPKPDAPIDKGMAGPGLLAYIVTSKFHDYLPLYRIERILERQGFEVARSTQSVWCRDVAELLRPLYALMVERVLASRVVATDDTIMPMQQPGHTARTRMWVYLGDAGNPYNVFDFTLNRGRDGPAAFLKDYAQTLLADGYGGYDGVVVSNRIRRAGCHAHARRNFTDAQAAAPALAAEALEFYRALYRVERRGASLDAPERLALRQREAAPLLLAFRARLLDWRERLLPKHPMAEAAGYCLNQWGELNCFLQDGAVPIDNNAAEREMKRVVLNRKNSLFVGNLRAGGTAAILASFTSTCFRHGIDPQRYFTQLLTNLPSAPIQQLSDWLPDAWKLRNTMILPTA